MSLTLSSEMILLIASLVKGAVMRGLRAAASKSPEEIRQMRIEEEARNDALMAEIESH